MSAIRPPVPSPLFPAQSPPSPVRASRSDFFRAALDGVGAPAEAAPAVRPAPPESVRAAEDRPQRPGSLLDIRV
ncbi:hypothetical protein N0B44_16890 [Roseibacterium beibuensis]|uniref:hypothetical protein n=1 Tax=[Roseibacterium] beibuensis TaxID=1193142 RepID=UPI00217E721A|nr:hypothetical protein [Roseibacterium beibuensis]MCS6624595.1 hypothetical protein [Roseibacterium beibuensis]